MQNLGSKPSPGDTKLCFVPAGAQAIHTCTLSLLSVKLQHMHSTKLQDT